jgi:hypothetical protein
MSRIQRWVFFVAAAAASVAFAAVLVRSNVLDQIGGHAVAHVPAGGMPPAGPVKPAEGGPALLAKAASPQGRSTFIVMFEEAPLATYRGDVAGIPAPPRDRLAKNGRMRLDPTSATSRAYVAYLQKRQADYATRMSSMAGRTLRTRMSMQHAVNAMVVELSAEEAAAIRGLAGVSFVEAYEEYETTTDTGPQLIGAPSVWNGTNPGSGGQQYRGEGMVVAVLDSGINFGSPSFAATSPLDGFVHTNPLGAGTFLGTCAAGGIDAGRCNAKLIGGFDFVCGEPANQCGQTDIREEPGFGDTNGHGTHVASTAAGNPRDVSFAGAIRRISGVAPRANVIAYDICYTNTSDGRGLCPNSSAVAALDHIVSTGIVDVVNYSIGGGVDPWSGSVSLAFLNAVEAGVYISAAAGNTGPGPETVNHLQPWVATVAAVQHGRGGLGIQLSVTGPTPVPANLTSMTAVEGTGGTPHSAPIPGNTLLKISGGIDTADDGCNAYSSGAFTGAIAVIRRGTCTFSVKVDNAAAAGAIAVVIANNIAGDLAPSVPGTGIPVFAVTQANGNALRDFAATRPNTTAAIGFPATLVANTPDVVASFSSRGPASPFNLLKPDMSAPGVSVLAADAGTALTGFETLVGLKSGTSMASPHHAGAVALARQARPSWSVPEVKSAFALTAYDQVLNTGETSPATPFDTGSGRIRVDRAINAGLVMHETAANYRTANPAIGGNPATLNQPNLVNSQCGISCTFTRTFRNPQVSASTWNLQLNGVAGIVPASITVPAGGSVSVSITVRSVGTSGSWAFGSLTLTPVGGSNTPLRLPIAVIGSSASKTNDYDGDGRADIHWRNIGTGRNDLWLMNGTAPGAFLTIYNEPNTAWTVVGSGDFNGDARADVLWRNTATGAVYVQHQDAGATLATSGFAPTVADANWQIVAIADFDGDGKSDLYWRNSVTGRNDLWLMNGAAPSIASTVYVEPNASWKIKGAGDFNGDGRADVFWRNETTGRNYLQFMDGLSILAGSDFTVDVADQAWQVAAIRDFDNDGRADLYWRNNATGRNDMWLMNGTAIKSFATVYNEPNQAWQIVNSGDYNADGFPDLLWRNASTGDNYLMLMQGAAVLPGSAMLPRVADVNWRVTGLKGSN